MRIIQKRNVHIMIKLPKTTLTLIPLTLLSGNVLAMSTDALVKPLHNSQNNMTELRAMNVSSDPCDDPALANFAQCQLENSANEFHWVSDAEYRDNVVQVVYSDSTCGGLLIDGRFILTARHCTPLYTENGNWEQGDVLEVYQGIKTQAAESLVFKGTPEVFMHDTTQRVEDGINYLQKHWAHIPDEIEAEWLSRDSKNISAGDPQADTYSTIRSIHSASSLNDVAIIKLPISIEHSSSNSFALVDNFDINSPVTMDNYSTLVSKPIGTQYNYQGWGQNAYGATPEKMKKWSLTHSKGQLDGTFSTFASLDKFDLLQSFESDVNFFDTCDSESLINFGDSGTPLFDQEDNVVGIASRITGCDNGFSAEWSTHLANYEFYKSVINGLTAPTLLKETIYTDVGDGVFTFAVQNISSDQHVVTPTATGMFDINHDCPQTLEPMGQCHLTVTYNGDKSSARSATGTVNLNANKTIPVEIIVAGTAKPKPDVETSELPKQIVIDITEDDLTHNEWTFDFDVSHLSSKDFLLQRDLVVTADNSESAAYIQDNFFTIEKLDYVDVSDDENVGVYRHAMKTWGVGFENKRDVDELFWAKPGTYTATLTSASAGVSIPVTVNYLLDQVPTDPDGGDGDNGGDNGDTGDGNDNGTDTGGNTGSSNSGGGSGGSTGLLSLLGLMALARNRKK